MPIPCCCTTPEYKQARRCWDGALVDVWMTAADAATFTGAFWLTAGDRTCIHFASGGGATPGTLYAAADATAADSCDDCIADNCPGIRLCSTYTVTGTINETEYSNTDGCPNTGTVVNTISCSFSATVDPDGVNCYWDHSPTIPAVLCGDSILELPASGALNPPGTAWELVFQDIVNSQRFNASATTSGDTPETTPNGQTVYPDISYSAINVGAGVTFCGSVSAITVTCADGGASPPLGVHTGAAPKPCARGQRMWARLHARALSYRGNAAVETEWLAGFAKALGLKCRPDWVALCEINPPNLSSWAAYFAWTVIAHNAVNAKLGKAEISLAEAISKWGDKTG